METLLLGNCLELMPTIQSSSIDLILADLPYGTTQCRWDEIIPFEDLWREYWRLLKPNGSIVLFAGQPFTSKLVASQIAHFKYSWVWEKNAPTGFLNAKKMPLRKHEDICVFYKGKPNYRPQGLLPYNKVTKRGHNGDSFGASGKENFQEFTNYPTDILVFDKDRPSKHPTQKPVALLEYLIKTYTEEGATVLDNTMGSGSTGVAAKNAQRSFVGIELDEKYYNIAKARIEA